MARLRPDARFRLCLCAIAALPAWAGAAEDSAGRSREVEPEFNAFVKLSNRARVFLLADLTRATPADTTSGELGIHLDYTLHPVLRPRLLEADWERARYLWTRVGYVRSGNLSGDDEAKSENRWLVEATARWELPGDVWLVNRMRVDFRDVGGTHSTRYRIRIGAEKEFAIASGTALVPYVRAEWFYDTRFDAWSRQLYQGGVEVELNKTWRIEPYYAYEKNTNPGGEDVNRFGLILKYYH